MKVRTLVVLALTVLALALPPVASAAGPVPSPASRIPFAGRQLAPTWLQSGARVPARVGLLGPITITGTVLHYDGSAVSGLDAGAGWGWYDPDAPIWFGPEYVYHQGGEAEVGADGRFTLTGVTSLPGHDQLYAYSDAESMTRWGLDFSTTAAYTFRPGRLPVNLLNPPPTGVDVTVGDPATGAAFSWMDPATGALTASTLEPGYNSIQVSTSNGRSGGVHAALDWTSPGGAVIPVTGGTTAGAVTLDWSQARRGKLTGPLCTHSGPPSSAMTYELKGWPAGYTASFAVERESDYQAQPLWLPDTVTSAGAGITYSVKLRLPALKAPDVCYVDAYRSDDQTALLKLYDIYQVCTLKASRTSITHGAAIRLSGAVPGDRAILYQRTTPAGQPTSLAARGWTRVRSFAVRDGKFITGWRKPTRTTWYVVLYGGSFSAFTKVVRVRVN